VIAATLVAVALMVLCSWDRSATAVYWACRHHWWALCEDRVLVLGWVAAVLGVASLSLPYLLG
jgi:hypothetical protein